MKSEEKLMILKTAISQNWFVDCENGEVYSKKYSKLNGSATKEGYIQIGTTVNIDGVNKRSTFYKHQIIACAYGYDLLGNDVNHINGDKKDNRIENLEVISHRDNMVHAWSNLIRKKEGCLSSIGIDENVYLEIKKHLEYMDNEVENYKKQLANIYGIKLSDIKRIHRVA